MGASRLVASLCLAAAIAFTGLMTCTSATASNTGGRSVPSAGRVVEAVPEPNASRTILNKPNQQYLAHTCTFDLSGIADGTAVDSLDGCGITVTFSPAVEKLSVPASWETWGSPPATESQTPDILFSVSTTVTLTFSAPVRIAGLEAEPGPFEVHPFTAEFRRPNGSLKVTATRDIDGNAGARLLAVKTKNIGSVVVVSDRDFAFAEVRVGRAF